MASSSSAAAALPPPSQMELEEKLRLSGTQLSSPPPSAQDLLCLLEKVELELKSVEPEHSSVSMVSVVETIRNALVRKGILDHRDDIIRVSAVCCICQIMRIYAPCQPYPDEKMKEVFFYIARPIENLPDDVSHCVFKKARSVLEVMAKVRGFVMVLDIDWTFAMGVFQMFFRIIRPNHPDDMISDMVEVMVQLIEASETVDLTILMPVLDSLRERMQDLRPLPALLGLRVLKKCAARLKPCYLDLLEKHKTFNHDVYSKVICEIFQGVPEGEIMVKNAGAKSPVVGIFAAQHPQVPKLDGTPTATNNNNDQEPDGSLKALNHSDQAEQLKDTDEGTYKGDDVSGMNEIKSSVEEPTNKSGSSSEKEAPEESALPSETGKRSIPADVLSPNSASTECQSSTLSRDTPISSGSSRKRGRPRKNQSALAPMKGSEGTGSSKGKQGRGSRKKETSPNLTVTIKKDEETVGNPQTISTRTRHARQQALNKEKDAKAGRIIKEYGESLVGSKVRVWWPLDRKFYEGVITDFDPEMKKHKVKYTDGEEEILNLNRERFEMIEQDSSEEEPSTDSPPEVSAESEKKVLESGSTPGKSIKPGKAPEKDNNTTDTGDQLSDNN